MTPPKSISQIFFEPPRLLEALAFWGALDAWGSLLSGSFLGDVIFLNQFFMGPDGSCDGGIVIREVSMADISPRHMQADRAC